MERRRWLRPVAVVLAAVGGFAIAPLAIPVLSVEQVIRYQTALGIGEMKEEVGHDAALNQHFADRLGWREYVQDVAKVYNALPQEEQAKCAILCSNYGQAAAIDIYGRELGLPLAISTHNNYWLWGPRNASRDIVIAMDGIGRDMEERKLFESGGEVARSVHPYSEEHEIRIYVFRNLKPPVTIDELWRAGKEMI